MVITKTCLSNNVFQLNSLKKKINRKKITYIKKFLSIRLLYSQLFIGNYFSLKNSPQYWHLFLCNWTKSTWIFQIFMKIITYQNSLHSSQKHKVKFKDRKSYNPNYRFICRPKSRLTSSKDLGFSKSCSFLYYCHKRDSCLKLSSFWKRIRLFFTYVCCKNTEIYAFQTGTLSWKHFL